MILKNISETKAELSSLLEEVAKGEVVLIGKAGVPIAKLIRFTGHPTPRIPGRLAGKIKIKADFDSLPPDMEDAFGMSK